MNTATPSENCNRNCWLIALAIGLLVALYLMFSAGWSVFWSLVVGLVILVVAAILLKRFFCVASAFQSSGGASAPVAPVAPVTPVAPPAPAPAPAPKPAPSAAESPSDTAPEAAADPEPVAEATPKPVGGAVTGGHPGSPVKPSTALPGQAELAARKGSWRYQGAVVAPCQATVAVTDDAAVTGAAVAGGAIQPEGLAAPREGGADNLKLIKGVGPKLEKLLNSMGYFHYDQIAGWSATDISWVDDNLAGFKGRVSRDNWVDQAGALAAGEETEFAKRAKKDGIYD